MKTVIIIPARYSSSRFPGKPLVLINGKSMIERVWLKCSKAIPPKDVYVATDSKKIKNHCEKKNIQVIMTNSNCKTGTDRVYEAAKKIKANVIINVQGDEPLVKPSDIKQIIKYMNKKPDSVCNAMCPITEKKEFESNSVPKVVFTKSKNLLYMSRAPIPYNKEKKFISGWKQVCIYGFPIKALKKFYEISNKTHHEGIEDIEILRFLELGFKVKMIPVSKSSIAVDYSSDVKKIEKILNTNK